MIQSAGLSVQTLLVRATVRSGTYATVRSGTYSTLPPRRCAMPRLGACCALLSLTLGVLAQAGRSRDRGHGMLCEGQVNFTITMRYDPYTPRVLPDDKNPDTGYSPLLCVMHDHRFRLWGRNALLPTSLVSIIRTRNFSEVNTYLTTFRESNRSVESWVTSKIIDDDTDQTKVYSTGDSVNITADGNKNATWVSCFAALIPSPDWFVGFERINLCEHNETANTHSFLSPSISKKLPYQYDAGVDNQQSAGRESQPQNPPSVVSVRTELLVDKVGEFTITNTKATPVPTPPTPTPECFPADAQVRLTDGTSVEVQSLQAGDLVDGGDGHPSPVYMMSHADGRIDAQFVRLHFVDGGTLTASAGHYVPLFDGGIAAMDELQPGAELVGYMKAARVVQRSECVRSRGLYNPHTLRGNLVVDGTLDTSYTRALAPRTAHSVLAVPRALYQCGLGAAIARIAQDTLGSGLLNAHLASFLPSHWTR